MPAKRCRPSVKAFASPGRVSSSAASPQGASQPSRRSGWRSRPDARWFRLSGAGGVDLTRRRALRGVLAGLVEQRLRRPDAPMSPDAVLEAGWPGERMSPESGARRVYVTIDRLRELGLDELLLNTGDGCMLGERVDVVRVPVP